MTKPLFIVSALLTLLLLIPAPLSAKAPDIEALDALVQTYTASDEPGISVAISKDGELIYENWAGLADLERSVPIGEETRFHIASISKQFTAFAIHKLAAEGKLRTDQPVSDFLPQMEASKGAVTIQHLLDHTGGLREVNTLVQMLGLSENAPVSAEQMLALIKRQRGVNFAPGSDEEYSNTGYQLLAHIVAMASGQSFAEYMRDEVLEPAGMTQTVVRTDPFALIGNVAVSYEGGPQTFVHHPILATGFGSTGMVSSPRDLLRWGHSLNVAELSDDPIMRAMAVRSTVPGGREVVSGNGQEFRNFRGVRTWSHGGTAGGFKSFLLRIPQEGIVIAAMGNRADFLKAAFAFDVAEIVLDGALEAAPNADLAPETIEELDSYAGDYQLFPGTVFSLRRDGQSLTFASYGSQEAFALPRVSKGAFLLNPLRDIRLEFRDFADGQATQMRWRVSEDGYIRAKRVAMVPILEPTLDFGPHEGTFYSDELQMGFDVFAQDTKLWIAISLRDPVPLIEVEPFVFSPDGPIPFARIEFVDGGDRPVQTILISSPLAESIAFQRKD